MLLTGTYPRTIDDKKRLALPKRVREQLGNPETLFLTPGPEQSLWLFTEAALESQAEKLDDSREAHGQARMFRRLYFAQTEAVDVDRSGRILLPDRLAQFAGLTHDVVLLGVRDHLELWDTSRWQEYLERYGPSFDDAARL
jgi:MraZ protein